MNQTTTLTIHNDIARVNTNIAMLEQQIIERKALMVSVVANSNVHALINKCYESSLNDWKRIKQIVLDSAE